MLKPLLWPACIWPEVHHLFQTGISVLEWTRKTSVTSNRQAGCPHGKSQAFFFFSHHCVVLHFLPMARAWWTSIFLFPTANCCSHILVPLNYIHIHPYRRTPFSLSVVSPPPPLLPSPEAQSPPVPSGERFAPHLIWIPPSLCGWCIILGNGILKTLRRG